MSQNLQNAEYWIKKLDLTPHPEGGYYKETFASNDVISTSTLERYRGKPRKAYTLIYYLLKSGQVSKFHLLQSDEIWNFYFGSTLTIHVIKEDGMYIEKKLGQDIERSESFQHAVEHGAWFGASVDGENSFALVGCFVSPGFDFEDFEIGNMDYLLQSFPEHHNIIEKLMA
jgi:uncharacterized protein